jgi:hypothetical protein
MKYAVKVGTLSFEQGTFQKGDIIELTLEEVAKIPISDIVALEDDLVQPEEVKVAVDPEPAPDVLDTTAEALEVNVEVDQPKRRKKAD